MVNSKKAFILLAVSSALIVLGTFFLSEAHALWTRNRFLSKIHIRPWEFQEWVIKPFMEKYHRWFPVYLIGGLALFGFGVTASFWTVRNWVLHRVKKE